MWVKSLVLSVAVMSFSAVFGAEYFVCQDQGDDANDGSAAKPFRTILHAVKQAGAGDTVNLVPGERPWRESVALNTDPTWYHPGGEQGNPLVIDGHGSWITGADPCPPGDWREEPDGVWTHRGMKYSAFLVIEGRLRSQLTPGAVAEPGELYYVGGEHRLFYRKQPGQPVPSIEIGQSAGGSISIGPDAWQDIGQFVRYIGKTPPATEIKPPVWVKIDGQERGLVHPRERLAPGRFTVADGVLHYRPPEGRRPPDMDIQAVIRGEGVFLGGSTSHVVIRNFNVHHVFNDGYNIHGACKDISFFNCNAEDCGDEGFSSHGDCETLLDGAVYINCDNGIFNVNRAVSVTRNAIIANSRRVGYGGDGQSRHEIENLILIDNPRQLSSPNITGRNILIVSTQEGPAGTDALALAGTSRLDRVTVIGPHRYLMRLSGAQRVDVSRSRFESSASGVLHIRHDDPGILRLHDTVFHPDTLIEWGATPPFRRVTVADALADAASPFAQLGVVAEPQLDALIRGERPATIPEDAGCAPELIERYLDFIRQRRP